MRPSTIRLLVRAADEGVPPVSRISENLVELHNQSELDVTSIATRQFIGSVVRGILEREGYEVTERGVKLPRDTVFRTGSVYGRVNESADDDDILQRFIRTLSDDEARRALRFLRERVESN